MREREKGFKNLNKKSKALKLDIFSNSGKEEKMVGGRGVYIVFYVKPSSGFPGS